MNYREIIDRLEKELAEVKAERDKLIDVIKALNAIIENPSFDDNAVDVVSVCRKVIKLTLLTTNKEE